ALHPSWWLFLTRLMRESGTRAPRAARSRPGTATPAAPARPPSGRVSRSHERRYRMALDCRRANHASQDLPGATVSENESKTSRKRVENDPKAETGPKLVQNQAETGRQYWHCYACGWTMVAWDKPDECEHCGEPDLDAEGPAEPDEPADADSKICASCRE